MALNLVCAVLDRGPANLAEMAVLLAIADSADKDTGEAWPSQATIARRSRQTDRSVRNVLERLRAAGWLSWETRRRSNGSQASNVYTLNLQKLGEARQTVRVQAEPRSVRRRNHVPPPPEPRSTHAPEPRSTLEPSQKKETGAQAEMRRCSSRSASPRSDASRAEFRRVDFAAMAASLTPFQRSRVLSGQSVLIDGLTVQAGSPEIQSLHFALRSEIAQNKGEARQ
jgi:hypothetical protein